MMYVDVLLREKESKPTLSFLLFFSTHHHEEKEKIAPSERLSLFFFFFLSLFSFKVQPFLA